MNRVAVLQSNYLPWKGYFDIIHDANLFLFYDEVQYTKNDWRNRNKILTMDGPKWLTLPCGYNTKRKINEVTFNPAVDWQKNHFTTIRENYLMSPFYKKYIGFLEYVYLDQKWEYLYELNRYLIRHIAVDYLHITTTMECSERYPSQGRKMEKLLSLLKSVDTSVYISGMAAKNYLDAELFKQNGIEIIWKDYSGYPEYRQMFSPFNHHVTILDLLFNTGADAPYYIWGYREQSKLLAEICI